MQREKALEILREHRAELSALGVARAYLFGSVARDEAEPASDVDVLVDLSRPLGWEFFDIQEALEGWFGCKVDVGTRAMLKAHVKERVLGEAVLA